MVALSGGGFRATVFHLGVLHTLAASGMLERSRCISAVSGGSILAALVGMRWEETIVRNAPDKTSHNFDRIVDSIRTLCRANIRDRIVWQMPLFAMRSLKTRPISLRSLALERYLDKYLYHKKTIADFPLQPDIALLCTNLSRGAAAVFMRSGHATLDSGPIIPCRVPLSRAVATSAAYPMFFPPLMLSSQLLDEPTGKIRAEQFSDGGVYDNLAVRFLAHQFEESGVAVTTQPHLIISDASGAFRFEYDKRRYGILATAFRASEVLYNRLTAVELERVQSLARNGIDVTTLRIGENESPAPIELHSDLLPHIRTDLDRMNDVEFDYLYMHGMALSARQLGLARPIAFDHLVAKYKSVPKEATRRVLSRGKNRRLPRISLTYPLSVIFPLIIVAAMLGVAYGLFQLGSNRDTLLVAYVPTYASEDVPSRWLAGDHDNMLREVRSSSPLEEVGLLSPQGLDYDATANQVFVADWDAGKVYALDLDEPRVCHVVCGRGENPFRSPSDVAYAVSGEMRALCVADYDASSVILIDLDRDVSSVLIDAGMIASAEVMDSRRMPSKLFDEAYTLIIETPLHLAEDSAATFEPDLDSPTGLCIAAADASKLIVLVADEGFNSVHRIHVDFVAHEIRFRTIVGDGSQGWSRERASRLTANIPLDEARLNLPNDIECVKQSDGSISMYIADTWNDCIRRVNLGSDGASSQGSILERVCGSGERGYLDDSPKDCRLNKPVSLTYANGAFYIADSENDAIRVFAAGKPVTTLVGVGEPGFGIRRGRPSNSPRFKLNFPWACVIIGGEQLVVSDTGNHQLLVVSPPKASR